MDNAVTKTIQGVECTFQRPSARMRSRMRDRWTIIKGGFQVVSEELLYEELMKNVVIIPHLDWEAYDENEKFAEEVLGAAYLLFQDGSGSEAAKLLFGESGRGSVDMDGGAEQ